MNTFIKGDGGAVGLTDNPSILLQWMVARPEVTGTIQEFEIVSKKSDDTCHQWPNKCPSLVHQRCLLLGRCNGKSWEFTWREKEKTRTWLYSTQKRLLGLQLLTQSERWSRQEGSNLKFSQENASLREPRQWKIPHQEISWLCMVLQLWEEYPRRSRNWSLSN